MLFPARAFAHVVPASATVESEKQRFGVCLSVCFLGCHLSVNKISFYSSNQSGSEEHISLITVMFCFNQFAFTVQVEHKISTTPFFGFILICLYFTAGHFHTCTLQIM